MPIHMRNERVRAGAAEKTKSNDRRTLRMHMAKLLQFKHTEIDKARDYNPSRKTEPNVIGNRTPDCNSHYFRRTFIFDHKSSSHISPQ